MTRVFLYSLIVIVLVSAHLYGQAKVGTTGGNFLSMSPSVRANGMGTAGVALPGHDGAYFNPALLGLFAVKHRGAVSFYPRQADYAPASKGSLPYDYRSVELSLPRQWRPWPKVTMGAAFYRTRLHSGGAIESSWSRGRQQGTGRAFGFQDWAWHGSTSLAYDGPVKLAVGLTYKSVHQEFGRYEAKTHAFDFGLAASMPLDQYMGSAWLGGRPILIPTVGISWANYGSDLELFGNTFPLPSIRRLGAAVELGMDHPEQTENWQLFGLTATVEHEKPSDRNAGFFKSGGELGIADALYLRAGRIEFEVSESYDKTVGFGINSRGLLKLALAVFSMPSSNQFLRKTADLVSIEFSFARLERSWIDGGRVSFYELALIFH